MKRKWKPDLDKLQKILDACNAELEQKREQAQGQKERADEYSREKKQLKNLKKQKRELEKKEERIRLLAEMFAYGGQTLVRTDSVKQEMSRQNQEIADCEVRIETLAPGGSGGPEAAKLLEDILQLEETERRVLAGKGAAADPCQTQDLTVQVKYWLLQTVFPQVPKRNAGAVRIFELYLSRSDLDRYMDPETAACLTAVEASLLQQSAAQLYFTDKAEAEKLWKTAEKLLDAFQAEDIPDRALKLTKRIAADGYDCRGEFFYLGVLSRWNGKTQLPAGFLKLWKDCFERAMKEKGYHLKMRDALKEGLPEYLHHCSVFHVEPYLPEWSDSPQAAEYREMFHSRIRNYTKSRQFQVSVEEIHQKLPLGASVWDPKKGRAVTRMEAKDGTVRTGVPVITLMWELCGFYIQKNWERTGVIHPQHFGEELIRELSRLLAFEQLAQYAKDPECSVSGKTWEEMLSELEADCPGLPSTKEALEGTPLCGMRYEIDDELAMCWLEYYFQELTEQIRMDPQLKWEVREMFRRAAGENFKNREGQAILNARQRFRPFYGKGGFEYYEGFLEKEDAPAEKKEVPAKPGKKERFGFFARIRGMKK